ncbi:uncharacterized protein METZ01_LOCUS472056, partial [marine metagenome]
RCSNMPATKGTTDSPTSWLVPVWRRAEGH